MTLVRWTPFGVVPRAAFAAPREPGFVPAAEVTRDGRDAVLTIELPGVDVSSDVNIEVVEHKLVVSGRREDRTERSDRGSVVRERRYGSFRRQFSLPEHVSADDVSASYEHGLLKVVVRGVTKELPEARKIAIEQPGAQHTEGTEEEQAAA